MRLHFSWPATERRLARILAITRIETLRLVRDRVTISLIAMVPAVQIVLFGYAVNLDPKNVPVAIAGGDGTSMSRAVQIIGETGYFDIVAKGLPPGAAARMVITGRTLVGIELSSPLGDEGPTRARVVVDAADPAAVRPALAALESAFWRTRAASSFLDNGAPIDVAWLYNPLRRTAWAIVPGLVGVIVMISMLMLGALTLVRERERGSWETLLATPVAALDALIGKLSPYVVIGTAQGLLVVGIAQILFDLPATSGTWALLAAAPVYAAANLVLGFAISALAESQMQAMQGAVFFYLPSMLLSGFMFPFQGMPAWARAIGEMLPLTHFVRAARGVLLKGEDIALVAQEMWPVALFGLAAAALALVTYRRRID